MENSTFSAQWQEYSLFAAGIFVGVAVLITCIYYIRLAAIKSYSKKYEFVSKNEASSFFYSLLFVVLGAATFLNSYIQILFDASAGMETILGVFIALILGFALGYAGYAYFKYYYPAVIENKLNSLRFRPRISPRSGKEMKLLTEDQEDVHLTAEMIAHEKAAVYEYDVWLDEESGHKFIERYDIHLHAEICPTCNFRTLRDVSEEVIKEPTNTENGIMINHFSCSYCEHSEEREAVIDPLEGDAEMLIA